MRSAMQWFQAVGCSRRIAGLKCNVPVHVHSHNSQHHRTNCTCPLFMSRFQRCAAGANVIMGQSNADTGHPKHNEHNKQMHIYAQICKFMHTAIHIVQVLSVIIGQSNAVRPDHTIHRRTVVSQHSGVVSAEWCGAEKDSQVWLCAIKCCKEHKMWQRTQFVNIKWGNGKVCKCVLRSSASGVA